MIPPHCTEEDSIEYLFCFEVEVFVVEALVELSPVYQRVWEMVVTVTDHVSVNIFWSSENVFPLGGFLCYNRVIDFVVEMVVDIFSF